MLSPLPSPLPFLGRCPGWMSLADATRCYNPRLSVFNRVWAPQAWRRVPQPPAPCGGPSPEVVTAHSVECCVPELFPATCVPQSHPHTTSGGRNGILFFPVLGAEAEARRPDDLVSSRCLSEPGFEARPTCSRAHACSAAPVTMCDHVKRPLWDVTAQPWDCFKSF